MASILKEKIDRFFGIQDRAGAVLTWVGFLVCLGNIANTVLFVFPRWGQLEFLRLHYTAALGIDWHGDWRYIMVFPGLAIVIFMLNGWLSGRLARRQRRLGLMSMALTAIIEIFIAIGGVIAVSLNG